MEVPSGGVQERETGITLLKQIRDQCLFPQKLLVLLFLRLLILLLSRLLNLIIFNFFLCKISFVYKRLDVYKILVPFAYLLVMVLLMDRFCKLS